MHIFDASNVGIGEAIVAFGPLLVAVAFYIIRFISIVVLKVPRDPWHDPRPMRAWSSAAFINAFLVAADIRFADFFLGCLLFVILVYFINEEYGLNI